MDETIARLNIEHYQWLLAQDIDESKRKTILRLLAEEQEKLNKIRSEKSNRRE